MKASDFLVDMVRSWKTRWNNRCRGPPGAFGLKLYYSSILKQSKCIETLKNVGNKKEADS